MKLSRRNVLAGSAAALGAAAIVNPYASPARALDIGAARHLVTLYAYGGWDTTYALDPKPGLATIDAPAGQIQSFGDIPIFTNFSRPAVNTFFQKWGGSTAVIRGIQMQSIVHSDCSKRLLTGTASDANPDMGSIVSFELGRELPAPYLVLGSTSYSGPLASIAARAGTVTQIRQLLDPAAALPPADPTMPARFVPDGNEADFMRKYLDARTERAAAVRGQYGYNKRRFDDFISSVERADVLRDFSDGFGNEFAFTLDLETQTTLGLDAIANGVCHSVHMEQSFAAWDTHTGNAMQDGMHQDLFGALDNLAEQLMARPGTLGGATLFDETVVAVVSEMGRTPLLNEQGGKDHWPVTSALIFGAGVRHGVYGQSSDNLTADNINLISGAYDESGQQLQYGNLAAGILNLAGVDAEPYLPGREPFTAFHA